MNSKLTSKDQENLLSLARQTLLFFLDHDRQPKQEEIATPITENMQQVMGAFVTLEAAGRLRGCIGAITPRRPLYEEVMEQVINASQHDPRFAPVQKSEVEGLTLEISALLPSQPVADYRGIVLGRHGIFMEKHGQRAVFLPQVALEQGWDLAETLTHLSTKAGLSPDGWQQGATFHVFEAIVFSE